MTKWSIGIKTEGDRLIEREEIVELADAVAIYSGIATGIETMGYGAQIVVEAPDRAKAIEMGTEIFEKAAAMAGLPTFPIVHTEAISEDEDEEYEL